MNKVVDRMADRAVEESALNDDNIQQFVQAKTQPQAQPTQYVTPSWQTTNNMESIMRDVVNKFVENTDIPHLFVLADESTHEAFRVHDEFFTELQMELSCINNTRLQAHQKPFSMPSKIPGWVVAKIVVATKDVRVMRTGSSGYKLITKKYYRNESTFGNWKWAGWWQVLEESDDTNILLRALRLICPSCDDKDVKQFIRNISDATECIATQADYLVYLRNGVWNYKDKTFTEYDDPRYDTLFPTQISLGKLPVYHPLGKAPQGKVAELDANGNVIEPVLTDAGDHTPWRPSQLFTDPFDMDTDLGRACSTVMWQSCQSLIRKRNFGEGWYLIKQNLGGAGHNLKGTIKDAQARLVRKTYEEGDEDLSNMSHNIIACSIDQLDDPYVLAEDIMYAHGIFGEESNGGTMYIQNAVTMKMLSRRQELTFRNIYERNFKFRFDGLLSQDVNRGLGFAEKNKSVIAHLLVIPFEKTIKYPRKYIKEDYINRDIVASYYIYKLTVDMPMLEDYDADALEILKPYANKLLTDGMTTCQFLDEALAMLPYEKMPTEFLYDLYVRWCELRGVTGRSVVTAKSFQDDVCEYGTIENIHQVKWDGTRQTFNLDEVQNDSEALKAFGCTNRLGRTDWLFGDMWINRDMVTRPGHPNQAKQFNRGWLVRTVPYDAMGYKLYADAE